MDDPTTGDSGTVAHYVPGAAVLRRIPPAPRRGDPNTQFLGHHHYVTADELEEVAALLRQANAAGAAEGRQWTVGLRAPRAVAAELERRRAERGLHPLFGARGAA